MRSTQFSPAAARGNLQSSLAVFRDDIVFFDAENAGVDQNAGLEVDDHAGSVLMRPMPWPIRRSRYAGEERQYCCRNCANAAQTAPKNFRRGIRRIRNTEPESWAEHIKKAAREAELDRDSKCVRLVCGKTSMYAGIDSLSAIIRYRLRVNPYDGSIYVFRDQSGTMLKYLHWDGQSFCQGKRRAQSGTYPWPDAPEGEIVEITEREFQYLLSRSIVPIKDRK